VNPAQAWGRAELNDLRKEYREYKVPHGLCRRLRSLQLSHEPPVSPLRPSRERRHAASCLIPSERGRRQLVSGAEHEQTIGQRRPGADAVRVQAHGG
jgi:hypothetical protein